MRESLASLPRWAIFSGAALVGLAWATLGEAQTRTTVGGGSQGGSSSSFGGSSGQGGAGQTGLGQSSSLTAPQGTFGIGTGQSRSGFRLGTTSRTNSGTGNPISQFYGNPMSHGVPGGSTGTQAFGSPLYPNTSSGSAGGLGVGTGFGVGTGIGTTSGMAGGGRTGTTGSTVGSLGRTGTGTTGTFGGTSGTLGGTGALGGTTGGRTGGTGLGTAGATGLGGNLGAPGGLGTTGMGMGAGRGTSGIPGGTTGGQLGGLNMGLGGTGMMGGRNTAGGMASSNVRRSVPYVAELAPSIRPAAPAPVVASNLRTQAQGVITRSSAFAANRDIRVNTEGAVVVLQGAVGDDRERQLAEALIRLTPGVRDVRNELQVRETTPAPTPIPD